MTEAELLVTFQGYLELVHTILFGYISFVSGFLIMSYLVAAKLSRKLAALVLCLFSAACGSLIFRLFLVRNDFVLLNQYILSEIQKGSISLPWFGANPPWGPPTLMVMEVVLTFGGFIGSVAFFLIQRRNKEA